MAAEFPRVSAEPETRELQSKPSDGGFDCWCHDRQQLIQAALPKFGHEWMGTHLSLDGIAEGGPCVQGYDPTVEPSRSLFRPAVVARLRFSSVASCHASARGHAMRLRMILFFIAVIAARPLHAREKSDVIIMKNGDRITCEIKTLRSDTLYIKVDYILSTLSVNWKKVDHIESKQLFLITTRDGTVYTGKLSTRKTPEGQAAQLEVFETPEKKTTLDIAQVSKVDE